MAERLATSQFRLCLCMMNGEEFSSEEPCGVFTGMLTFSLASRGAETIGETPMAATGTGRAPHSLPNRPGSSMLGRLFARVGGCDNGADGLLVEAFEATPPLEGFQVAADRAFG